MSSRYCFLDSSIIYIKKRGGDPKYIEFSKLIRDSDNILVINDLVRLEVLQGINYKDRNLYEKFVKLFDERFEVKEINQEVFKMATQMDRYLKSNGMTLKEGKTKDIAGVIDIVNFCTAKYYGCQIFHNDEDFVKMEEIYSQFWEAK